MTIQVGSDFSNRLAEIIGPVVELFEPFVLPNPDGDCVEFFVSPENYFAERVDDYVTVYRCMDDETTIVGFVIKNISRILENLSRKQQLMKFIVQDDQVQIRVLFTAMLSDDMLVRANSSVTYQEVADIAEKNRLDQMNLNAIHVTSI